MSDVPHRDVTMTATEGLGPAIENMPETVAAFVGRTLRGPLNTPVLLASFGDFRRRFGGLWEQSSLGPAVRAFFQHGGRYLYVVRVANAARGPMLCLPADGSALILRGIEPGYTESLRAAVDYDRIDTSNDDAFNLTVQRINPDNGLVVDQEYFRAASHREDNERFIGDLLASSSLARIANPYPRHRPEATPHLGSGSAAGYVVSTQRGSDGAALSDYDLIGSRERCTGLFALDQCEHLDLLYLPSPTLDRDVGPAAIVAAEMYCRQRGAMLILDPDRDCRDVNDLLGRLRNRGQRSANMLTYYPSIRARAANEPGTPCGGAVLAGILCKHDRQRGPWHCLGPPECRLDRAWQPAADLDPRLVDTLVRGGVNAIVGSRAGRARVCGSVTLSRGSGAERCFDNLGVRRGCLRILNTVKHATRFAAFQTDDIGLERRIEDEIGNFFRQLANGDALATDRFVIMCYRSGKAGAQTPERGVAILLRFHPTGAPGPLSFTLLQTEEGCRITTTAFAPVIRDCA